MELLSSTNDLATDISDISRNGVTLVHDNTLKLGDTIDVNVRYQDIEIKATAQVSNVSDKRAGAFFIDINEAEANKLLYLELLLKNTYGMPENLYEKTIITPQK